MRAPTLFRTILPIGILLILMLNIHGCALTSKTLIAKGTFSKCVYKNGLADPGYADAVIYYPCDTKTGPFGATTLTGGFTNTKEQMSWLSDYVVSHGYIVMAIDPVNNLGLNDQWQTAHRAGISKLTKENKRAESPIHGLVDTQKLQIMGFSKGGGGVLLAGSDLGNKIQSIQALAPFMDGDYDLAGIQAATICYTSTADRIVPQINVIGMFNKIPSGAARSLAYFNEFDHLEWNTGGSEANQDKAATMIITWMKIYLDGDANYQQTIDAAQDWFFEYRHNPAGSSGSSD